MIGDTKRVIKISSLLRALNYSIIIGFVFGTFVFIILMMSMIEIANAGLVQLVPIIKSLNGYILFIFDFYVCLIHFILLSRNEIVEESY